MADKIEPLNMHGHANTWEEELLEVVKERDELRAEIERLRAALLRLVELGEDDGSAPDDAWKSAFQNAAALLGKLGKQLPRS